MRRRPFPFDEAEIGRPCPLPSRYIDGRCCPVLWRALVIVHDTRVIWIGNRATSRVLCCRMRVDVRINYILLRIKLCFLFYGKVGSRTRPLLPSKPFTSTSSFTLFFSLCLYFVLVFFFRTVPVPCTGPLRSSSWNITITTTPRTCLMAAHTAFIRQSRRRISTWSIHRKA